MHLFAIAKEKIQQYQIGKTKLLISVFFIKVIFHDFFMKKKLCQLSHWRLSRRSCSKQTSCYHKSVLNATLSYFLPFHVFFCLTARPQQQQRPISTTKTTLAPPPPNTPKNQNKQTIATKYSPCCCFNSNWH